MDKNLEQLAQYVGRQLDQGIPEQVIRASLAQNRWTPEWIDAAFNVVHQNPAAFTVSEPQQPIHQEYHPQTTQEPNYVTAATRPQTKPHKHPGRKALVIMVLVTAVLIGLAIGGFLLVRAKQQRDQAAQTLPDIKTPSQTIAPKAPDDERKDDLNVLLSKFSDYYVAHSNYPTYTNMTDAAFMQQNFQVDPKAMTEPGWSKDNNLCAMNGTPEFAAKPATHCYSYEVTTHDGAACDNAAAPCERLTLTATLQNNKPYAVTLNRNAAAS